MKLGKILLGVSMIFATATFAQDGEDRECLRMRKIANDAMGIEDYKEASTYFLRGETICGNYDASNYGRLTGSLIRLINAEQDKELKKAYADTLMQVWERMDDKNLYEHSNDMLRGYYYLQLTTPNYIKADTFFSRGVAEQGTAVKEMYIPLYYYNTYSLYYIEQDVEKKADLKKRMINDYFDLTELITKANFSIRAQESITGYFRTVVTGCDDLNPEIARFIETLPTDVEAAKVSLMRMITLMEEMNCTDSQEYMDLINKYLELDPESPAALEMKAKILENQKQYRDANVIYEKLILLEEVTDERKDELRYKIVYNIYNTGSYQSAYNKAMSVKGPARGKSLVIAAQSVGKMANSCGESTFLRKCNYLYAARLLEQSGVASAKMIAEYKALGPTPQECFQEGNPASVTLECWGVTVSPCN